MTTISQALAYSARGWSVFPVYGIDGETLRCLCGQHECTDSGKHPMISGGVLSASNDPAVLREWFGSERGSLANIGLATGTTSGVTVLDIDIGEGKVGQETWANLHAAHGEPVTLMAQTGGGGFHVFFQYDSHLKSKNNAFGPNVDCKNDGGYVVIAPSRHRSGATYTWLNWGEVIATLPAWLVPVETRGRPKKGDVRRQTFALPEVAEMLTLLSADDRDLWRSVGIILGRTFERSDLAWEVYQTWSATWGGARAANHDRVMHEAFYDLSALAPENQLSMGTIVRLALDAGWTPKGGTIPVDQFVYYGAGNNFLYRPTSAEWIAAGVDAVCGSKNVEGKIVRASDWLKRHQAITSITCDPLIDGDMLLGKDCRNGSLIDAPGAAVFNLYRPASIDEHGDPAQATLWVEHVRRLLNKPGDADQFINYMAHRVQHPGVKPRFALLMAGGQGVGKDTAVDLCVNAIGAWNVKSIEPSILDSAYTSFKVCTLLRIHEASNIPDMGKWAFNEQMKTLIAGGGSDGCDINPKYGHQYTIRLYCGVILTTNHLLNGIFIPEDDRRYDVLECATFAEMELTNETKRAAYFEKLYTWAWKDGTAHIAAFLRAHDLKKWSPDHGQRKTLAHKMVVQEGRAGDVWLMDILDELGNPDVIKVDQITSRAVGNGEKSEIVSKRIPHALSRAGYIKYARPGSGDGNFGRWKVHGKWVVVYVKSCTTLTAFQVEEEIRREIL